MKITFEDINKRTRSLKDNFTSPSVNMMEAQIYTDKNVFCQNNAVNSIKYWESLGKTSNEAFDKALDIFDEICKNCNDSVIRTSCNILMEDISKVRNPTQLANSIKYKAARMKRKSIVKLDKAHSDVTEKINNAIHKIKKAENISPNNSPAPSSNVTPPSSNNTDSNSSGVASECYTDLYNKCLSIKECDRIVNNYNNISKVFNLDRIVTNVQCESDLYQACAEISSCVDTYDIPFKNKYNSALETTAYVFDKHYMNYPKDKIIEAVTDYFLLSGSLKEAQFSDVRSVMNISVLFEQSDFSSLSWMNKKESNTISDENKIDIESYGVDFKPLTEADIKKDIDKKEKYSDNEIHEIIDDFRSGIAKNKDYKENVPLFKRLISKIFTKSPYSIVNELPSLFSIIRITFIVAATAINPIIGIISLITDLILKNHFSRKQMEKVINIYNKEINSIKEKINKAKDESSKQNLEKYLKELKNDLEKLKDYERTLYSEKENDERDTNDDDFDDDFGFDDDFNFDEAARIIYISNLMESISENLVDTDVDGIVYNNIFKLNNDSIDALTDFSITVPVILEKDKLKESLINYRNELRKSANNTSDYVRIDCINENIYKLDKSGYSYSTSNSTRDAMMYLTCLNEITKINSGNYIMEMDFVNTIKLAINNLKKNIIKLSDKEKKISNSIDVAANNVIKGIQKSMSSNNRDSIIKGNVLPSVSKCIKTALIYGTAWAINPAIAIIGAIGNIACSAICRAKERQTILDDIDIELKMCKRHMRNAEEKNDMKKIRQIEVLQRNLLRQKQRIENKMAMLHQKVQKVDDSDD